ncbi:MAG: type VI secretion system tip protein VgrG [Herminiimonas sp.]|nr:type VI secretion system tip protein VgrG [Herminiimonas sp.]
MPRIVTFNSPLGDALLFRQLDGHESFGSLFHFTVKLVSTSNAIKPAALLGKGATVVIELERGATRYLNAQVIGFRKTGEEQRYTYYEADLAPWLWYATRAADCRIFQNMTAVEIAEKVLQKYGFPFEKKLAETYQPIGYYVQYNETDFQFLSRLFQQEGIYYYFTHADGVHTLTLADYPGAHPPLANHARIRFVSADKKGMAGEECVIDWEDGGTIKTGRYITDDYHFKTPSAELQQIRNDPQNPTHGDFEIYNWGQGYTNGGHGAHLTKVELEALQHRHASVAGSTTVRGMAPGYTFALFQHPDASFNLDYVITGATYHFQENPYSTGDSGDHTDWKIGFTAQKSAQAYRSVKTAAWPHVGGPHTAVVVGPKGKELWCDEFGRVKVQFPWDRYGKSDENSSCWIRVSSPWAGSNYGGVHVPRIGQEVLVEYLNGEVNRPIITGRVYNAEQMPPWSLPANATQSGFLSRSTPGGGYDNANAIRFEDKKGAEQLWIQAERNLDTQVENDESHHVMHDRKQKIDHDESITVGNNKIILVHGSHQETIKKGMSINVTGGNQSSTVEGDITVMSNNGVIKFMVGASSIIMTKDHIVIDSPRVDLNPGGVSGETGAALAMPGAIAAVKSAFDPSSKGTEKSNDKGAAQQKSDPATPAAAPTPKALDSEQKTAVEQALKDQQKMLEDKISALKRWNKEDQAEFKKAFGSTTDEDKNTIGNQLQKTLDLSKKMTADNFLPAEESVSGIFAYVYPDDEKHQVYLDEHFWKAPATGRDSKAGVLTHEMSHFLDVGSTADGFPDAIYGVKNSRELAVANSANALRHADSFEYWVEGGE